MGIVGWNYNSLGDYTNQIDFINKIRKINEDIIVLFDTKLSLADESPFRKLWGERVYFNFHSSNKRGIAILIKNRTPIEDIQCKNIIKGNFSSLTFKVKDEYVLHYPCLTPASPYRAR